MRKTGIVVALPKEIDSLYPGTPKRLMPFHINKELIAIVCGMGMNNATFGAMNLVHYGAQRLISWGVATALSERLIPGDLLLPTSVMLNGKKWQATDSWRIYWRQRLHLPTTMSLYSDPLTTSNELLDTPTKKKALHSSTAAAAADMESAAIAEVASQHKLDFLIFRAISDDVHTPLPACVTKYCNEFADIAWPKFIYCLLKNPGQLQTLYKLGHGFKKALHSLSYCAKKLEF